MLLFLIGFMGAGKSYTGKSLAKQLNWQFIDLDDRIEEQEGCTISELFAKDGEHAFRLAEQESLRSLAGCQKLVIATGGGTPCFFDNMEWMNTHGVTIYLAASVELLAERLNAARSHRPLLAHLREEELVFFIEKKLEARTPFYKKASIVFRQRGNEDVVAHLLTQLADLKAWLK